MDDNTAGVLVVAALILAFASCYITSTIIDYLRQKQSSSQSECAEPGNDSADVAALRRDLKSAEDELGTLRRDNARLREAQAALGVFQRQL